MAMRELRPTFLGRGRANLAALLNERHVAVGLIAVDEVAEALARLGIGHGAVFHSHS